MTIGQGRGIWFLVRVFLLGAGAIVATSVAPRSGAAGYKEQTLYSFCSTGGENCTDGKGLFAGLVMDASGNLYGTTSYGGAHNDGTVFELKPNSTKTAWTEKVLYSFCTQVSCKDGAFPVGGLVMDSSGNLYGTTQYNGAHCCGTVFELTPNSAKTAWTQKVLYSFCAQASCNDGGFAYGALIMDKSGNLYGTADGGGAHDGGTAFELKP